MLRRSTISLFQKNKTKKELFKKELYTVLTLRKLSKSLRERITYYVLRIQGTSTMHRTSDLKNLINYLLSMTIES